MKKIIWMVIGLMVAGSFTALSGRLLAMWQAKEREERVQRVEDAYTSQQQLNEKLDRNYELDKERWEQQKLNEERQWQMILKRTE